MKHIYIGFAFLLFGNIIANIPSDLYQLAAVCLGLIGCIVLGVGIYREYGSKKSSLFFRSGRRADLKIRRRGENRQCRHGRRRQKVIRNIPNQGACYASSFLYSVAVFFLIFLFRTSAASPSMTSTPQSTPMLSSSTSSTDACRPGTKY